MPLRETFATKEEYNAWYKAYRAKNRIKLRKYNRVYNKEYRKKHGYDNEEKWKFNNANKVKAQRKLQKAIKLGKVFKRACLFCQKSETIGHHPNYDKPLEVIWVCKIHHRQIHYCG